MPDSRKLHLGAFMRPVSIHTAAWRYPGGFPDANFNFQHLKRFAQTLERGKFDAFFMADHLAVLNMPMKALMRSAPLSATNSVAPPSAVRRTSHFGARPSTAPCMTTRYWPGWSVQYGPWQTIPGRLATTPLPTRSPTIIGVSPQSEANSGSQASVLAR